MTFTQIDTRAPEFRKAKQPWYRSPRAIRHGVMLFFFLFLLHVAYDHQVRGGGPNGTPSVEAYCPFGGIESLYQFITTGGFVRRIEPSAMILMGAVLLLTLIFSRGFCGWICPFGSVQEWLGLLGRKIFGKSYNPTGPWEKRLRYLKYVVLGVIVAFSWHLGALVFRPYDPFLAFFHLGQGFDEMPYAYAALGVVLLGSLKYERFFCKYACPLGAVIGIVGKLGLTKIVRSDDGCKGCNICQKKCFAHIEFLDTNTIRDAECNHCLDCVAHCPKPNVLALKGVGLKVSHSVYAVLLVAGLFGTIGVSQLAGKWRTKPAMVSFSTAQGKLDPEQIRGWMSLAEISNGYGIPLDRLYEKAKLPANVAPATRLNQVARTYNIKFEPDKLRDIVGEILTGQPARVPEIRKQESAVKKQPAPQALAQSKPKSEAKGKQEHPGGEQEIRGMMTLNEIVMQTGVPKDYILKKLEISDSVDPRVPLREWMHEKGKSIQDVRDAVANYRTETRK